MFNRRQFLAAGAAALAPFGLSHAQPAGPWPLKPVRVVVPFQPGGTADKLGRLISNQLSQTFKQPFVVENRPGAGGIIGSQQIARSAPDGYSLVISGVASHVIAPATTPDSYDPMKDFTHIAMLAGLPTVLVVNAAIPVTNMAEFIAYAKAQPDGLSWGSPGVGTQGYLIGEMFAAMAKLKLVHIGYKGGGAAMVDLLSKQISVSFTTLEPVAQYLRSGKLRGIAIASQQRLSSYSQIPTFVELGYEKLVATTWFALSGPAGLPAEIVARLNTEVRRALSAPEIQAQFARDGYVTNDMDAAAFTRFFQSEIDIWTPYAKALPKES
jgi:tripartite-type tricarboxylate transporter receptor subunit TctC